MNKFDALAIDMLKEMQAIAVAEGGVTESSSETIDYLWDRARMLHRRGKAAGETPLTEAEADCRLLQTQAD